MNNFTIASATTAAPDSAPPQQAFGGLGSFLPIVLIFAILYFMMIRPAQRKEKERKKEIEQLRAGTKVLFGGGILGEITEVKEATFKVRIAESTVVEIARGAVQRIIPADNAAAAIAAENSK